MPDMIHVDSSSIEAIGYDESTQELHIKYLKSGETYVYNAVEQWRFDELMRTDSKGQYVNAEIKPNHTFSKL